MKNILEMLKKILIFLVNVLIFMFFRRTLIEHGFLLSIVLVVSTVLGLLVGVPLYLEVISLDTESWPAVVWMFELVESFLDVEKLTYIGLTYAIALVVFLLSDFIIEFQNKRQEIPLETLKEELKVNSRAVLIVMSGALSLFFKVLIGMLVILLISTFCLGPEMFKYTNMTYSNMLVTGGSFLWFDIVLFVICRFLVSPMKACLESQN